MTCRVEDSVTYKQTYNAENRLSNIMKMSGDCITGTITESWSFSYDGDGTRMGQVYTNIGTGSTLTTLYFMGGAYETTLETNKVTKYYAIAGMTLAMNDGSSMQYLLTDHLGSVVAVTDASGSVLSQQRYLPFGQVRTDVGSITQTDFGYTGQRANSYIKLEDYHSRWFDSYLNRWTQPDSIVPDPYNPQSFNRYSYVFNRPIYLNDPDGRDPIPGYVQFIQQAVSFFSSMGYQVIGDPAEAKTIFANGADIVFTKAQEVLAVEVKNISAGNVNLGTLGYSIKADDYGGSIDRVVRSAGRFANSSNEQLESESQAILNAGQNLKNALYTNAKGASDSAQDLFNGVYTNAKDNTANVVKALPGTLSSGKSLLQTIGSNLNDFGPIVIPRILINPIINPYFRGRGPAIIGMRQNRLAL
jgi:RHS repeat-associated protein